VGILAWEAEGKRGYLFEGGQERVVAEGYYDRIQQVQDPTPAQQQSYAKLRALLEVSKGQTETVRAKPTGPTLAAQIELFHEEYPAGLQDPLWRENVRGEDAKRRVKQHRDALVADGAEHLSCHALDTLMSEQRFGDLWKSVVDVLSRSDLIPAPQLKKLASVNPQQHRALAAAVRELLYGNATYDQRFDRFLTTLTTALGDAVRWETATALAAVALPSEHVAIHSASFRQQLNAVDPRATLTRVPSADGYRRLLNAARLVANRLAEQGEVPRDLFDVHDFIRTTLRPATKARLVTIDARQRSTPPDASVAA
jgi:hypothetical protein